MKKRSLYTKLLISTYIIIFLLIYFFVFNNEYFIWLLNKFSNRWLKINNNEYQNTTGVSIEILTWNIDSNTGNSNVGLNNPRDYLDYQMSKWTWWIDYIIASPTDQPKLNSKESSENSEKMHLYLYQNRINFEIANTNREWYILFITTYPIKNTSNIFIWLEWKTIWWLDKEKKLQTENDNEFLYQLSDLRLIWNNNYKFSKDLSNNSTISINAVLWEMWNYVEKIIIFFK